MARGKRKQGYYNRTDKEIESDIKQGSRVCTICNTRKPYKEFRKDKYQQDGRMSRCKDCMVIFRAEKCKLRGAEATAVLERTYQLRRKYGLSLEQYDELLKKQEGSCAICGSSDSRSTRTSNLFVDHCHTTGKIRGLLCHHCNIALGYMEDDIERLRKMIEYISDKSL